MSKRDKWLTLQQIIEHIMRSQGMTEDEAKAELLRALRAGELTAWGIPVSKTERRTVS